MRATWCICVNPDLGLQLWRNFLIRNSMNMKMMRNFITVSRRLQIEQHWQPYSHLQRIQRDFGCVIDHLTRHSYIAKLKITSSWCRAKSKDTTGVKNTASYTPWLYATWDQMVASSLIHCFISNDNNHYTSFLYQVQTMSVDYLEANYLHVKNLFTFLTVVEDSTKTIRTLWICISISIVLVLMINGCFFGTSYCKSLCGGIGRAVKRHVAKWSLQRSLNN